MREDENFYNSIIRWSFSPHIKNSFHSTSNSRDVRAFPLPLGGKYKTLPYTERHPPQKLEEKHTFLFIAWSHNIWSESITIGKYFRPSPTDHSPTNGRKVNTFRPSAWSESILSCFKLKPEVYRGHTRSI